MSNWPSEWAYHHLHACAASGCIASYRAVLHRNRVGLDLTVFLSVKIDRHANDAALEFERVVTAMPEVVACHLVAGQADHLVGGVVPEVERYQPFRVGKLLELC